MSTPKERHYWAQLRSALTAGQWRSHAPAKTPSGAPLSWSELFRKFNKHCRGAHDMANVASHTYTLALFISEDSLNEDADNDVLTLGIDPECPISRGRVEKIKAGYEELQSLESSNLDAIHFALAYYAYALGNPAQCIAHLEKVPDIHQAHILTSLGATMSSTNLLTPSNAPSITSSFTPSFASPVDSTVPEVRDGRSLALAESFRSICLQGMALEHLHPTSPLIALKTYCFVFPHLFPSLKTLFTHKSLLPNLNYQHQKLSSSSSNKLDFTVFYQAREIWRWVERIIWRAVVLCADVCDVRKGWQGDEENLTSTEQQGGEGDSLWSWLSHYVYYSAYWPSTFRTSHRSTISSIHIRALILLHRPSPSLSLSIPSSPSSPIPSPSPLTLAKSLKNSPPAWLNKARQVIQDYQAILNVSTTFPRAGTRNEKVEEFVDLCVAVWEVYLFGGGAGEVGWVIDILWWATRLTFNSSRILRHMTRLLYLSGDTKLARRTLNLYIQVVGKAYETNRSELGSGSGGGDDTDTDTDSNWVDTLIFGATMLFKFASLFPSSSSLTEMDDLNEARQIIEKAKTRLNKQDKRLVAKMYLAEGVYWMMLGVKGQDPLARPTHLSLSHSLLLQSVETDPTPSGYYNLALSYAVPGGVAAATQGSTSATSSSNADSNHAKYNLHQAIQYAGLAVEADPRDVKYWHLLGLLLTAQERWEEAREVLERGADLGVGEADADVEGQVDGEVVGGIPSVERMEHEDENDTVNGGSSNATPTIKIDGVGNISIKDVSPITSTNPLQPIYILSHSHSHSSSPTTATTPSLPPASTLLLTPPPSKYPPSQYDLFESHLQIRMTQGTVMEVVEGAEGAEAFWLEVFGWVAERKSALAAGGGGVQRRSIDGITQRSSDHISSSHHHSTMTTIDGSPHHLHPNSNPNPNVHHLHHDQHQHQHQQHSYLGAPADNTQMHQTQISANGSSDLETNVSTTDIIPITISPATPIITGAEVVSCASGKGKGRDRGKGQGKDQGKEKRTLNNAFRPKRSTSIDIERDNNRVDGQRSKKNVGQMLKGSVMKSRAGITAATKKLGHGVVRHGGLRRSTSTPDFHVVFQQQTSYQASSIHSRRRLSFMSASRERPLAESPPPPPAPIPPTTTQHQPSSTPTPTLIGHQDIKNERSIKDDRLLSNLWLMSAATFRRLGKIDQAKGAIQEAEVKDENNPAVWVQFGLYYIAIGLYQHAVDTFQKALFICPDDVAATVHLSRLYLDPDLNARLHTSSTNHSTTTIITSCSEGKSTTDSSNSSATLLLNSDVDLAAGMLSYLTKGKGWNVPEAWYYLAKAYGLQGRKEKEKEILRLALELSERRGVRDVGSALGWCYL